MSCVGRRNSLTDCTARDARALPINDDFFSAEIQSSLAAIVKREILQMTAPLTEKVDLALNEVGAIKQTLNNGIAAMNEKDHSEANFAITNSLTALTARVAVAETHLEEFSPKFAALEGRLIKREGDFDELQKSLRAGIEDTQAKLAGYPTSVDPASKQPSAQGQQVYEEKIAETTRQENMRNEVSSLKHELLKIAADLEGIKAHQSQKSSQPDLTEVTPDSQEIKASEIAQELNVSTKVLYDDSPADESSDVRGNGKVLQHGVSQTFVNMYEHFEHSVARVDKLHEDVRDAYEFQDSINDLLLFVGIAHFGFVEECLVVGCFLINAMMQGIVCYTITRPVFASAPFDEDMLTSLNIWRVSDAHSNAYADPERSPSLVSRVCSLDPSLTSATIQQQIYQNVSDYQEYGGSILAIVCMTFFVLSCASEIRQCLDFLIAVGCLPRATHTIVAVEDNQCKFHTLSCGRMCSASLVFLCRLAVPMCLCYNGCVWLAYTQDIADLLLNAAALNFVLQTPTLVFSAFVPTKFWKTIRSFEPVEVPQHSRLAPIIPYFLLGSTTALMVAVHFVFVAPFTTSMQEVEDTLCGGEINFVFGLDYVHQIFWTKTEAYGTFTSRQRAIHRIVRGLTNSKSSLTGNTTDFERAPQLFNNRAKLSGAAYIQHYRPLGCNDYMDPNKNWGLQLWAISGINKYNESLLDCKDVVTAYPSVCYELSPVGTFMRFACPHSCGCGSATSGLGELGDQRLGCPVTGCTNSLSLSLRELPCNDTPLEVLNTNWSWQWKKMAQFRNHSSSVTQQPLLDHGCAGLGLIDQYHRQHLCHYPMGASTLCPETCSCTTRIKESIHNIQYVCPRSCLAAAGMKKF